MDTDDLLAAHALEALRQGSVDSCSSSSSSSSVPNNQHHHPEGNVNDTFLEKVSAHPIVSSAVKAYNSGKSYSPTFKYSAEKIEAVINARVTKRRAVSGLVSNPSVAESISPSVSPPLALSPSSSSSSALSYSSVSMDMPLPNNPKKRPRWRRVLTTATSLAALSSESRQRLRYCLRFLKLANTHLAGKLTTLQELVDQKRNGETQKQSVGRLRSEIIVIIRKAVTVVSTFAGNSLPEPARTHVRASILTLPAKLAKSLADDPQRRSSVCSNNTSPSDAGTPTVDEKNEHPRDDADFEMGSRVLSLTKESLCMLEQIIMIVDETLDKAEIWCEKLGKKKLDHLMDDDEEISAPPPTSGIATHIAPSVSEENSL